MVPPEPIPQRLVKPLAELKGMSKVDARRVVDGWPFSWRTKLADLGVTSGSTIPTVFTPRGFNVITVCAVIQQLGEGLDAL